MDTEFTTLDQVEAVVEQAVERALEKRKGKRGAKKKVDHVVSHYRLNIPRAQHEALVRLAEARGLSLQRFVVSTLLMMANEEINKG